jgi:hypothetical protein
VHLKDIQRTPFSLVSLPKTRVLRARNEVII